MDTETAPSSYSRYHRFEQAVQIANQGIAEEEKKNYAEALKHYQRCLMYFTVSLHDEVQGRERKEFVETIIKRHFDRAVYLKKYLKHQEKELVKSNEMKIENLSLN